MRDRMGHIRKTRSAIRDLDQSPRLAVFGGPSSTFCAFVSRPFVAHNCTSMRRPFFHGNAALSRAMTQAFGPRARSCAFGARTELIIGTWNGSAAGSLGGEADARPRAPPQLILSVSLSFLHAPSSFSALHHLRLRFHLLLPRLIVAFSLGHCAQISQYGGILV